MSIAGIIAGHIRVISLEYDGPTVGSNEMKNNHWAKISKKMDKCKEYFFPLIQNSKVPSMQKMGLLIRYNTGHDADNLPGALGKAFVDQLRKMGRIPEDNKSHYLWVMSAYDKKVSKGNVIFDIYQYE